MDVNHNFAFAPAIQRNVKSLYLALSDQQWLGGIRKGLMGDFGDWMREPWGEKERRPADPLHAALLSNEE